MPAFFGIICPRRVVPSRANAAARHKMSRTDIPQACPRGMSGNATHQDGGTYSLTRGRAMRGRAKRAHKGAEKRGCARKRDRREHEARTSAEGKRGKRVARGGGREGGSRARQRRDRIGSGGIASAAGVER